MYALVDTGCTRTIVSSGLVENVGGVSVIVAFDGRKVRCKGSSTVELCVHGSCVQAVVAVADEIVEGIGVVMGMDVIRKLGGVTVNDYGVFFNQT